MCGEEGEHKEEEKDIYGKCRLYMEGLRFSLKDFVWVTGETNDCELWENKDPQAVVGGLEEGQD